LRATWTWGEVDRKRQHMGMGKRVLSLLRKAKNR
jgi:hypothetical protein